MYVDNMVSGGETEEEVLDLCIRSKDISEGSIQPAKFYGQL